MKSKSLPLDTRFNLIKRSLKLILSRTVREVSISWSENGKSGIKNHIFYINDEKDFNPLNILIALSASSAKNVTELKEALKFITNKALVAFCKQKQIDLKNYQYTAPDIIDVSQVKNIENELSLEAVREITEYIVENGEWFIKALRHEDDMEQVRELVESMLQKQAKI